MACHQLRANSVFEPMITYRQLDPQEIILGHFNHIFQSEYWTEWQPYSPGLGVKWVNN